MLSRKNVRAVKGTAPQRAKAKCRTLSGAGVATDGAIRRNRNGRGRNRRYWDGPEPTLKGWTGPEPTPQGWTAATAAGRPVRAGGGTKAEEATPEGNRPATEGQGDPTPQEQTGPEPTQQEQTQQEQTGPEPTLLGGTGRSDATGMDRSDNRQVGPSGQGIKKPASPQAFQPDLKPA